MKVLLDEDEWEHFQELEQEASKSVDVAVQKCQDILTEYAVNSSGTRKIPLKLVEIMHRRMNQLKSEEQQATDAAFEP